jgi:copper oxidase (laccase) domain-containing protein
VREFKRKLPKDAEQVIKKYKGKEYLDNKLANKIQLLAAGLKEQNIEVSKLCTGCANDRFYSFRTEGDTGRFGAGIMLKK